MRARREQADRSVRAPGRTARGTRAATRPRLSCRAWISKRGGPEGLANLQWVLGYLTAYGVDRVFRVAAGGDASGKLRPTSPEEIGQIIDKYCAERHPDSSLRQAADDVIRQLGGTRPVM